MKPPAKILVIRRDNIGDLVCTTPLLRALRLHFPDAELCALVNSYTQPVLTGNPDLERVYVYTKAKHRDAGQSALGVYWARLKLIVELRRKQFDYVILAGSPSQARRGLGFARLIGARHVVGFTEPGAKSASRLDMGIPYTLPQPLHETEDTFRLLAPLGITGAPGPARVFPQAEEITAARQRLSDAGIPAGAPVIGVHISARKPSQRWPVDHFAALMRQVHEQTGAAFMLFWSPGSAANPLHPGDDEKAGEIIERVRDVPVMAYPTHHLHQLIGGLAICDGVVCSDGGAMHLAAGLGKPIVCFFGRSDPVRWHPWGVPYRLLQPASQDVADISPEQAFAALESLTGEVASKAAQP
jgi:ADP-heptose:LPS heptosyltransferase